MVAAAEKIVLSILFPILYVACVVLVGAPEVLGRNKVMATYIFPESSIGEFQNKNFPGSVSNDHKLLLGSMGSDLRHGPTDARDEFWMITDRGPKGQIAIDGKNRRTFWVPEFNPTIIKIRLEGGWMRVIQTIPLVGRSGRPVTGLPNLKDVDETPYDYAAKQVLSFNQRA